jgi:hypothetical protein
MAFSMFKDVIVRNARMASLANLELSAYTSALIASNFISYRMRANAPRNTNGVPAQNATAASFAPNEKEMAMQPMTLKMEMRGKIPLAPNSSCS